MLDYCFITHSQALKGDFPLKYDYALKVKQQACSQIIMTTKEYVDTIYLLINKLVDVKSVSIVHVDRFDDEL